jgi:hypothetical protein
MAGQFKEAGTGRGERRKEHVEFSGTTDDDGTGGSDRRCETHGGEPVTSTSWCRVPRRVETADLSCLFCLARRFASHVRVAISRPGGRLGHKFGLAASAGFPANCLSRLSPCLDATGRPMQSTDRSWFHVLVSPGQTPAAWLAVGAHQCVMLHVPRIHDSYPLQHTKTELACARTKLCIIN